MNLSRFRMNGVARPFGPGRATTWLRGNGSRSRFGGVMTPTGALTMTVAFGVKDVPGTRPVDGVRAGLHHLLVVGRRRPDDAHDIVSGPAFPLR